MKNAERVVLADAQQRSILHENGWIGGGMSVVGGTVNNSDITGSIVIEILNNELQNSALIIIAYSLYRSRSYSSVGRHG